MINNNWICLFPNLSNKDIIFYLIIFKSYIFFDCLMPNDNLTKAIILFQALAWIPL